MTGLVERLSEVANVRLNRRVTLVDWSLLSRDAHMMDKVLVECLTPEGHAEEFYADFVISTLPLGVMKKFHQRIFYPGLDPQKVRKQNTYYISFS